MKIIRGFGFIIPLRWKKVWSYGKAHIFDAPQTNVTNIMQALIKLTLFL